MEMNQLEEKQALSIDRKYGLSIKEAAEYFNIGEQAIRSLTKIKSNDFTLIIGKKVVIKREAFARYLDTRKEI